LSIIVHVVGTGTIGEPLIGILADEKETFGIDEVTFHKRTPTLEERGKIRDLERRGAVLATNLDRKAQFEELGHEPRLGATEAIERASVVIDCTPAGLANKQDHYEAAEGPLGFMAQGSELGFGKMYARGINDEALDRDEDKYLHIVSCNTHNISALIKTLAMTDGVSHLENGRFACLRRANDISQDTSFVPSPTAGAHNDERFGTHHARDAHHLFTTLGFDLPIFSSAMKLNTQYMHSMWFSLTLDRDITRDEIIDLLTANPRVALTHRNSANSIFSFGRDHGYFGRILNQAVIPVESLTVRDGHEVIGFCFTPQDGNSLLSSIAATLWYLYPDGFDNRIDILRPYLFQEL
jgi:glyceraldehyde-3-phosphate dehydrogenase type II